MPDTTFEFVRWRYDHAARAERAAVLYRLTGHRTYPGAQAMALENFIERRRVWISQLRHAGHYQLQKVKYGYARNCPSCAIVVNPRQQPCKLAACPFCYARRVAGFFERTQHVVQMLNAKAVPWQLVSYRRQVTSGGADNLIRVENDSVVRALRRTLKQYAVGRTGDCRDRFPDPLFLISWWGVEPVMFRHRHPDGIGYWKVTYAALAVMPATWKPVKQEDCYEVLTTVNGEQLADVLGKTFYYPRGLLDGPPELVVQLCNTMAGTRAFQTKGTYYRGVT